MSPAEHGDHPARILIVDDEPAVREALQRSLVFEGYVTEQAVDGLDAVEKVAVYDPELIVLDVLMPRMDGLTAARRLRASGVTVPILMLTARDTVGDRVTGLDSRRRRLSRQALRAGRAARPDPRPAAPQLVRGGGRCPARGGRGAELRRSADGPGDP